MNTTVRWFMAIATVVPLAGVGCKGSVQHGEEASHALPPHHPRTFHRAVDAIAERHAIISASAAVEADRDRARSELLDILRWLPDLAADTSLKRSDWDEVAAIAGSLTRAVETGVATANLDDGIAALRRIESRLNEPNGRDEAAKPAASSGQEAPTEATP